jgi:hypothetical protein
MSPETYKTKFSDNFGGLKKKKKKLKIEKLKN